MQPIILLVTGSRSIRNKDAIFKELDAYAEKREISRLYHGGAVGVDTLAGEWAEKMQIPVTILRPDFKTWPIAKYRWKAYAMRDFQMVDAADEVVAIWDGSSSGTRLTFEYAERKQKHVHMCKIKNI